MKRRDLIKELEKAGYEIARDDGDHTIYSKDMPSDTSPEAQRVKRIHSKSNPKGSGFEIRPAPALQNR